QVLLDAQIQIFTLDGPVRSESIFKATARCPAGDVGRGSRVERHADVIDDACGNMHGGTTSLCVQEYTIPGDTDTAAIERIPIANGRCCESISQPGRIL